VENENWYESKLMKKEIKLDTLHKRPPSHVEEILYGLI
jgi:hypothetical protein